MKLLAQPLSVLLVEPDPESRIRCRDLLAAASAEHRLTAIEDLDEAVERLRATPFDVVLSDILWPEMSAVEVIRHLRLAAPDCPLVVWARAEEGSLWQDALAAGAQDVLRKDLSAEELERSLLFAQARGRAAAPLHADGDEAFRALVHHSMDMITIVDPSGAVRYHSPSFERMLGYSQEERMGARFGELFHPQDRMRVMRQMRQVMAEPGKTVTVESRIRHKDGSWREMETKATNLCHHPQIRGLVINSWDATERREAVRALREQEARFRAVAENLSEGVVIVDLEGRIVYSNPRMSELIGFPAEALLGRSVDEFVEGQHTTLERFLARPEGGRHKTYQAKITRPDGVRLWIEIHGSPFRDASGEIIGGLAAASDISDRKRAEQSLRLLESAVEGATDGIVITNADLDRHGPRVVYANPAFYEMSGYERREVIGLPAFDLLRTEPDEEAIERFAQALAVGRPFRGEIATQRKDGSQLFLEWQVAPIHQESWEAGEEESAISQAEVTHFVIVQRNVTEQRALEDQLRESQKMEAIGRLAGGVAHDFNNLLTAIMGYQHMLEAQLDRRDSRHYEVEQIGKAANRAAALTRQLLAFSRRQVLQPRVFDLNSVVEDVEEMLSRLLGEEIELSIRLDSELAKVRADPGQLEQVIVNLAINARDAMPRGGRLQLVTANAALGGASVSDFEVAPGTYVMLAVCDSGEGMSREVQERIFEPFFTTKPQGKGTGLGLSTAYGIVKQSGGHIDVESELGGGATFRVYLPPAEEIGAEERWQAGPTTAVGSETVLLVEDDGAVRGLLSEVLSRGGYRVLTAANGEEALAVAAKNEQLIDLLISDVVMPDLRGPELGRRLAASRPHLKMLFISGYTDSDVSDREDIQGAAFLQKPFSPEVLARKVRMILSRPAVATSKGKISDP